MSDTPSSSSGKSKEEVAFDILSKLKGVGIWGENNKDAILDMYAECLIATSGKRLTPAQKAAQQQPVAPLAQPRSANATLSAARQLAQSPQDIGIQPVHAQQAKLQQAFKPGT